ncbi:hypothetical protein [Caulobacter sp. D4A]|uniref:hypothetical protein n=1 Tax=Caulobacter sp. D4A TaxID=2204171 RepID=UPI0011B74E18|nr:hypothetical protein [Caulobacter sp. D4A]
MSNEDIYIEIRRIISLLNLEGVELCAKEMDLALNYSSVGSELLMRVRAAAKNALNRRDISGELRSSLRGIVDRINSIM